MVATTVHTAMKSLTFKVNYGREPRMGFNIRKKEKHVKTEEFVKKMKTYADKNKKIEENKVEDKVLISMKDFLMELMKRVTKKLVEEYIGSYVVKKIILENVVELELLALLRIQPVVNVRRIVKY